MAWNVENIGFWYSPTVGLIWLDGKNTKLFMGDGSYCVERLDYTLPEDVRRIDADEYDELYARWVDLYRHAHETMAGVK